MQSVGDSGISCKCAKTLLFNSLADEIIFVALLYVK